MSNCLLASVHSVRQVWSQWSSREQILSETPVGGDPLPGFGRRTLRAHEVELPIPHIILQLQAILNLDLINHRGPGPSE